MSDSQRRAVADQSQGTARGDGASGPRRDAPRRCEQTEARPSPESLLTLPRADGAARSGLQASPQVPHLRPADAAIQHRAVADAPRAAARGTAFSAPSWWTELAQLARGESPRASPDQDAAQQHDACAAVVSSAPPYRLACVHADACFCCREEEDAGAPSDQSPDVSGPTLRRGFVGSFRRTGVPRASLSPPLPVTTTHDDEVAAQQQQQPQLLMSAAPPEMTAPEHSSRPRTDPSSHAGSKAPGSSRKGGVLHMTSPSGFGGVSPGSMFQPTRTMVRGSDGKMYQAAPIR
jgi:hypothetical protein